MKALKKIFINLIAVVMTCMCMFSLTGCIEDIKKLELKLQVYDYANSKTEEYTLSVDLYRHLAPNTVDAIIGYVNEGYYDGALFYKMEDYSSQIMIGDLIVDESGKIAQNAVKPQIEGEFEKGGTIGSNLVSEKGSIGLWRSWTAFDNTYKSANATDTGRATWYIPTSDISSYNKYFCVFAQYDTADEDNADAIDALTAAFGSAENYDEYVIYYTGKYDESKADENYGLEFHCESASTFVAGDISDLFTADKASAQLVCYNHYTVRVPEKNGAFAAKISSAKIV